MNDTHKTGVQIFISYSHKDKKAKDELLPHLKTLQKSHAIQVWHDGMIPAGGEINATIQNALEESQIILLLISVNYIASDFCYSVELRNALERHAKGECIVVPIIIKPTPSLDDLPFGKLKRVPFAGRPICYSRPKDKGYAAAITDLEKLLPTHKPNPDNSKNISDKTQNNASSKKIPHKIKQKREPYPCIHLYKDGELSDIKLPQQIVESLPDYVQHIINFYDMSLTLTTHHITEYCKSLNDCSKNNKPMTNQIRFRLFRLYLFEICAYLTRYLLGKTGVRVHFRGLHDDQYVGLVVNNGTTKVTAKEKWAKLLTPMPANRGMIYQSNILGAPLIKSMNPEFHEKGTHDEIWIEYLTCALKALDSSIDSLLSMGVSVKAEAIEKTFPLLQFLAYIKIDHIICQIIKKYCQACQNADSDFNIKSIIEAYS